MRVLKEHNDGTKTTIFDVGDHVRLKCGCRWIADKGEYGFVWDTAQRDKKDKDNFIEHIGIRTDAMIKGNWGVCSVAPWHLEYVEEVDEEAQMLWNTRLWYQCKHLDVLIVQHMKTKEDYQYVYEEPKGKRGLFFNREYPFDKALTEEQMKQRFYIKANEHTTTNLTR